MFSEFSLQPRTTPDNYRVAAASDFRKLVVALEHVATSVHFASKKDFLALRRSQTSGKPWMFRARGGSDGRVVASLSLVTGTVGGSGTELRHRMHRLLSGSSTKNIL
jgi:hypothetical protein